MALAKAARFTMVSKAKGNLSRRKKAEHDRATIRWRYRFSEGRSVRGGCDVKGT
jgi:hypothetical protein